MAYLLVLITDMEESVADILDAWEKAGVPGVTLIDAHGSKHKHNTTRDDLPFVVSLRAVLESKQQYAQTVISVIEDPTVVEQATNAVLRIIPDFAQGHRGIMFSAPLQQVWGYTSAS